MSFPLGDKELRIGILGMTEGNGHPYSWSTMFNGGLRSREEGGREVFLSEIHV